MRAQCGLQASIKVMFRGSYKPAEVVTELRRGIKQLQATVAAVEAELKSTDSKTVKLVVKSDYASNVDVWKTVCLIDD